MIEIEKNNIVKLGIIGFIGTVVINIVNFLLLVTEMFGIIILDILSLIFGVLISTSLYILSNKFGKNGIKIAAVCNFNFVIINLFTELIYYITNPTVYSLEYYEIISIIDGLIVANSILFIINNIGIGFSLYAIGRDYSKGLLRIVAILWLVDIFISFFISFFSYLTFFHWIVVLLTCYCIWKMIQLDVESDKSDKDIIKLKAGI
ncbi:MAG: hypothetical protein GF329_21505 [Candidatus Lokiarchaeota archaeon]|nr:hypothetical protein [Candidatus Lokiarchaeota archaeon]